MRFCYKNIYKTLKKTREEGLHTRGLCSTNTVSCFWPLNNCFLSTHLLSSLPFLCLFSSQCLLWEFMPPLHILSLSYLSSYLCSLCPSNCFSTALLAEEPQLFKIQLPVQLLNSCRILNRTLGQSKHNVLCFSSAVF